MPNPHIIQRLQELCNMFRAADAGGNTLSSASKGAEREFFIHQVLSNVIAPPFRIGSGDITDASGHRSGQSDVVIEYGNSISFPMILPNAPRLYLAEGVCAVIEIKSNLSSQWDEVVRSRRDLAPLQRNLSVNLSVGELSMNIPHFAVGYRGWKTQDTLKEKMEEQNMDGILVLDAGLYYGKIFQGTSVQSLFAFLMTLERLTGSMISATPNYLAYMS
ncbi:MAG TPA: DUF6602 domain-containing protein [Rhabdochlamydiaceae bacterium]|nr:DUF6602 domain-containing protein [Rhabdochlamydiaceae bacterium]